MSYAKEIENRAIFNNWNSYSRGVGKLRIRGISEERQGSGYYGNRIGTEVCWKNNAGNSRYYNNQESNGADWILRVYADGTAYFYPNKLQQFNRPTSSSISDMVYKHFRVIKTIDNDRDWYRNRFQILRRKPVGQLSKKYFIKSINFGEYLVNKFNDMQGDTNEN